MSSRAGKSAETRPEDQQASGKVPLRVRLLRWNLVEFQEQPDEGISIAPAARAQRHEEDLKRRQRSLGGVSRRVVMKVNCKEINSKTQPEHESGREKVAEIC